MALTQHHAGESVGLDGPRGEVLGAGGDGSRNHRACAGLGKEEHSVVFRLNLRHDATALNPVKSAPIVPTVVLVSTMTVAAIRCLWDRRSPVFPTRLSRSRSRPRRSRSRRLRHTRIGRRR